MAKASIKSEVTLALDHAEARALRAVLGASNSQCMTECGLETVFSALSEVINVPSERSVFFIQKRTP